MRLRGRIAGVGAAVLLASAAADAKETIVFLRHGEKPPAGLGQIDCRGLNRALKLPGALARIFYPDPSSPRPAAVFAANPSDRKKDKGVLFDYVRPLATIEPTAVALGLPVDTQIGISNAKALRKELERKSLHDALVLVAWEHGAIVKIAKKLLGDFGG